MEEYLRKKSLELVRENVAPEVVQEFLNFVISICRKGKNVYFVAYLCLEAYINLFYYRKMWKTAHLLYHARPSCL